MLEKTNTANVTEEQMKPYMVSMDELKSFDNDEMAHVKEMISKEINGIDIDFSIPGRIELELKYFDKIISKGIELIDCVEDAIKEYSSTSPIDEDTSTLISSICSGVKNILNSFDEYKEALEEGDPSKVNAVYKSAFAKALIREVDLVNLAPYCTVEDVEELMSSTLEQIKQAMNNEFDVEKASSAYENMLDQFDQVEQLISNDFDSFVDMVA